MKNNDGGPAFPRNGHPDKNDLPIDGISLRDYFAAKAMQGLVSAHNSCGDWTGCGDMAMNKNMAGTAYAVADAMLKARE